MNRYLCVLTNFENIDGVPTSTIEDLGHLYSAIRDYCCDWVTISSFTGDPLYNFGKNLKWWSTILFDIVPHYVQLELHTSYISVCSNEEFCGIFESIIYHCHSIEDLKKIRRCGDQTVHVAFDYDCSDIDQIKTYIEESPFIDGIWTDNNQYDVYYVDNIVIGW
jgi:hypothetical protein